MTTIWEIKREGEELDLVRQMFEEYQVELNEDLCFQSFQDEVKNPLEKYSSPRGGVFLAYWNGEPAGCIALYPLEGEGICELKRLYVRPAYRKHGIGRALIERVVVEANGKGYTKMKLDTLDRLVPAIALYREHGFQDTTAYYRNPLNGVVYMEKVLV